MGSINWDRLPKNAKVKDMGTYYSYRGKIVTWSSFDSVKAQMALRKMAKRRR